METAGESLRFGRRVSIHVLILVALAAIALGYLAWRRYGSQMAPSELCDRIEELTDQRNPKLHDQCIGSYTELRELYKSYYRDLTRCVDEANTARDVDICTS